MPHRRPHRKSRTGCAECKKRHIKVFRCKFCNERRLACHYACKPLGPRRRANDHHPEEPGPSASPSAPLLTATNCTQIDSRLLEATLLHHYYTNTHSSLVEDEHSQMQWQVALPKVATTQPFALDSLLAFTALHLAYLEPNRRHFWTVVAFDYSDKACSALSRVISRLSAATADAAMVCSIYIVLFAIAQYRVSGPSASYLDEVLRIAKLIRGCVLLSPKSKLFDHSSEEKAHDGNSEIALQKDGPQDENNKNQQVASKIHHLASRILSQLHHLATNIPAHRHAAYTVSIQYILDKFDAGRYPNARPDTSAILIWPLIWPESFATLLQERDFIARVVFLLYPLTLHFGRDKWYVGDLGEVLRDELIAREERIPPEWGETVETIRRAFEEGDMIPG